MKSQLLCIPCTVRTAYDIAVKATKDKKLQRKIVYEVLRWLTGKNNLSEETPPRLHTYVQRLACKITGNDDPFKELKRKSNEIALKVMPVLERKCQRISFEDTFRLAVLGTICGNTIDFEVEGHEFSMSRLEEHLIRCLSGSLAIDDVSKLMDALSKSKKILYLLDNSGEIVFDKFLMRMIKEKYPVKIFAAVKSGPILNDATLEDTEQIRLGEVAEVITTGNDHIGINLEESSEEFLQRLREVDLIIAKGQGHYESITEFEYLFSKPIVYVLRAKCVLVAESLGVQQYGNVVKAVM
ncbi:TPA: DUF89 family protein [Candidatus Bathyarchaeota archaeon]|nr:DUF89 family protein [Candidatus Bathyarchaeota archaeon]